MSATDMLADAEIDLGPEIDIGPCERHRAWLMTQNELEIFPCLLYGASQAYKENGRHGREASKGPNYNRNVARRRQRGEKAARQILDSYKSPLALKGLAPGEQREFRKRG